MTASKVKTMASNPKSNFKAVFKQVGDSLRELGIDNLAEVAEFIRSRIVQKARSGKTMASGKEAPLRELSADYKRQRRIRQLKGDFTLDPDFFRPAKSNVTLTGIYLDSIEVRDLNKSKGSFTIAPNREAHGQDDFTNQKLAEYLAKQGRSIYGIDGTTKARVSQMVKRGVRDRLKKNLLKK